MSLIHASLLIGANQKEAVELCAQKFVEICKSAIADHGYFSVALSGGSTPKVLYQVLCSDPYSSIIPWNKIHFFWSDERSVKKTDEESNFFSAMKNGFEKMPLDSKKVHRMQAEENIAQNALDYETKIQDLLQDRGFDLILLGMGDDGHTASLFPDTEALKATSRLVVENFVPQKDTWRMTFTLPCINQGSNVIFLVTGPSKKQMLRRVFKTMPTLPCQLVGTEQNKALWIVDLDAAENLRDSL